MDELHVYPVVGNFHRIGAGHWRADRFLPETGTSVRIFGEGETPTQAQLDRAHRIAARLAQLLLASGLGRPPTDDVPAGWEMALQKPRIRWIRIAADGCADLALDGFQDGPYHVAPLLELSPELSVISASWGV